MDDAEAAKRLSDAIRERMTEAGITQEDLGRDVARIEGRADVYPQATVATWLRRRDLLSAPHRVFAIEKALGAPAGSLSRLAGFLPLEVVRQPSTPEVIRSDAGLTRDQQEDLLALYEAMLARTRSRRLARGGPGRG